MLNVGVHLSEVTWKWFQRIKLVKLRSGLFPSSYSTPLPTQILQNPTLNPENFQKRQLLQPRSHEGQGVRMRPRNLDHQSKIRWSTNVHLLDHVLLQKTSNNLFEPLPMLNAGNA